MEGDAHYATCSDDVLFAEHRSESASAQGHGPLRGVRAVYAQAPPGLQWRLIAQIHPNAVLAGPRPSRSEGRLGMPGDPDQGEHDAGYLQPGGHGHDQTTGQAGREAFQFD